MLKDIGGLHKRLKGALENKQREAAAINSEMYALQEFCALFEDAETAAAEIRLLHNELDVKRAEVRKLEERKTSLEKAIPELESKVRGLAKQLGDKHEQARYGVADGR